MAINDTQNMNNQVSLTDALTKAIEKIIDQKALESKSSQIIQGTIVQIIDHSRGTYEIEYLNTYLIAITSNKNYNYNIGDQVYILVQDGDMSKEKIIIAAVNSESTKIEVAGQENYYIPYGDNVLFTYDFTDSSPFQLSTFEDVILPDGKTINVNNNAGTAFNTALRFTRTFDFCFKIKTEITDTYRRINGNYGLYLNIPIVHDNLEKEIEIFFDINKMIGNPYNFMDYTDQHYYFTIPDNAEIDTKRSITLMGFDSNFPKEDGHELVPDLKFIDIGVIPVKVLSQTEKEGYNLKLTATNGSFFGSSIKGNSKDKDLIPNLYYNGKLVNLNSSSKESYKCYWFVEDNSITATSSKYNINGGTGWRILNNIATVINDEDPYITDEFKKTINQDGVKYELNYKCVIITPDNQYLSDTILIKNLDSVVELILTTSSGSNKYVANLGNVELIMKYSDKGITDIPQDTSTYPQYIYNFYWQRYNKTGTLSDFNYTDSEKQSIIDGVVEDHITYGVVNIDERNTFQCTVILNKIIDTGEVETYPDPTPEDPEHTSTRPILAIEEYIVGSRSITIITDVLGGLNVDVENDIRYYKYDWSGNSPLVANYDGSVSAKEKLIKPISILRITDENGIAFTEEQLKTFELKWYIPAITKDEQGNVVIGTMLEIPQDDEIYWKDVVLDNGYAYHMREGVYEDLKSINYTIRNQYQYDYANKGNNVIILEATLKDKKVIKYINNIIFAKDGQSGTNGTNYTSVITYGLGDDTYEYGEIDSVTGLPHKCQLLFISDMGKKNIGTEEDPIEADQEGNKWFVYNPAWITRKDLIGNNLGLLYVSDDTESDESTWPQIKYTIDNADGTSSIVYEKIRPWKQVNGKEVDCFVLEMYCQGQKLEFDDRVSLESSWKIFDGDFDYGGILSPIDINSEGIFNIKEKPVGRNVSPDAEWKDVWLYEYVEQVEEQEKLSSFSIFTIVEARARAKQLATSNPNVEEDPTNSPFYVYAYYPIEATYISNAVLIRNYIPSMVGGFDSILFNTGGLRPEYDSSNPFSIVGVDGLEAIEEEAVELAKQTDPRLAEAHVCEYHWTTSPNLFYSDDATYSNSVKIQPTAKFKNDFTKNYVKVQVDFNDELRNWIEILKDESIDNYVDITDIYNKYQIIDESKFIFDSFNNDSESCPYNRIRILISDQVNIFNLIKSCKKEIENIAKNLSALITEFKHYTPPQAHRREYESFMTIVQSYRDKASEEITSLNAIQRAKSVISIEVYLTDIQNLFRDRTPEERYIFTDNEVIQFRELIDVLPSSTAVKNLSDSFDAYQDFVPSTEYVVNYTKLIDPSNLNTLINISTTFNQIQESLNYYLNNDIWGLLLTLMDGEIITPDKEDLKQRQDSFLVLYNTLLSYYQQVKYNENIIDNPCGNIIEIIDKMDLTLNPFKNYDITEMMSNLQQQYNKQYSNAETFAKILNLVEDDNKYKIIHCKPIVMLMNRYELGYLNEWDGNKLKIDDNGGYILAPTMGAGRKENDNSFTGMVMGMYKQDDDSSVRIGLFGRAKGKESLFLDAQTGAAVFGLSGDGQIYIDPTEGEGGRIFSGNYYTDYDKITGKPVYSSHDEKAGGKGMLIHMKDGYIHFGGKSTSKIYSGLHDSHDTSDPDNEGRAYPGFCLDPKGLTIGNGIKIDETGEFYFGYGNEDSDEGKRKYLHFDPNGDDGKGKFKIGEDVELVASKITSESINGLHLVIKDGGDLKTADENVLINEHGIKITNGDIGIRHGQITLGSAEVTYTNGESHFPFEVGNNGILYSKGAVIDGKLFAGSGSKILDNSWVGNWLVKENGKLIGHTIQTDSGAYSSLRLDPESGRIGFMTGAKLQSGNNDFAYIGGFRTATSIDDASLKNAIGIFTTNTESANRGNFLCNKIDCYNIDCTKIKTNGHNILCGEGTVKCGHVEASYVSINPGDASASVNGKIKITQSGIWKCEEYMDGNTKKYRWVQKI